MHLIENSLIFAELSSLNFHPLEAVFRYRDPQVQVREHPLQAANCCRNSRLVVDEDDLKLMEKYIYYSVS